MIEIMQTITNSTESH